jgi:molecular chaperone Hsp33
MTEFAGGEASSDVVQPFQIVKSGLRGRATRIGGVVDTILARHDYPEPVAGLVAEAVALTATLGSLMKFDGSFSLQAKGDGPVSLLLCDVTSDGEMRACAHFDPARLAQTESRSEAPVAELLGRGHIAFTVDQGIDTNLYQGIVDLAGPGLADAAQHYFRTSEQLDTGITVEAGRREDGRWQAGCLLVQRLPDDQDRERAPVGNADEDDWRRAMILMASATRGEMLDARVPINTLLFRLFHEDGVKVSEQRPVSLGCRCSRERSAALIASVAGDLDEVTTEDGEIVMNCHFCNRDFVFLPEEIEDLREGAGRKPQ